MPWQGEHYTAPSAPMRRAAAPSGGRASASASASGLADVARGALGGGRASVDTTDTFYGTTRVVVPPTNADDTWRTLCLDSHTLDRYSPDQLLQLLADLSPEVSRALWDFLRFCNPGYTVTCLLPDGKTQDEAAQVALDAFLKTLNDLYGSVDVVIGRLFLSAFLRGAFFAELVLDKAGRVPVDLATPDPATVRFQSQQDPARGTIWQVGQYQPMKSFVPLDRPTVRYIPIDPFPGSPYGRPIVAPALFTALFLVGLLHDLRRVVSQQGYPRPDVVIDSEKLLSIMPADARADPQKFMQWANATLQEIQTAMKALEPDDWYVHLDTVVLNRPVGTVDSHSLGAIDPLIKALERMLMRALKSMPLMMGLGETASETASNREYEAYVQGIKSVQHYAESLLSGLMQLALQAQGIATTVEWRFAENRAAEMLRDQQVANLTIENAMKTWAYGFASMDEAAQMAVGHPADAEEPRALFKGESLTGQNAPGNTQPEPGSNRTRPFRVVGGDGADG